jgi:hypothetical protein
MSSSFVIQSFVQTHQGQRIAKIRSAIRSTVCTAAVTVCPMERTAITSIIACHWTFEGNGIAMAMMLF